MGFESWRDFDIFKSDVKTKGRFIHTELALKFLNNLKESLSNRIVLIDSGATLYRAQPGYEEEYYEGQIIQLPHEAKRMKPILYKGSEGRANPKGISYLYLASDPNTAMSELRPHVGELISLGYFKCKKSLHIVNCYSVDRFYGFVECIFNPPTTQIDISNAIWSFINEAFSKPIARDDQSSDYVPTQILAEYFKSLGYDGICYKSSLSTGYNFMLFDLNDADIISGHVMEVSKVAYEFKQISNTVSYPTSAS